MANREDFKKLVEKRLSVVNVLMDNQEWGMAAYMMGFVLECVLKAAACKALNLSVYPDVYAKETKVRDYFKTHNFEMLSIVSGTSDLFGLGAEGGGPGSWSGFVQEYTPGLWTDLRYEVVTKFDEKKARGLHQYLTGSPDGIIPIIENNKRW